MAREPWDQLPNETDEAYKHFLIYRNLGINRNLRKAYRTYLEMEDGFTGSGKGLHVPGNWYRDIADNHWQQRATSWDIRNLHAYGARLAILHTQAVTKIAEKCVRLSRTLNPGDKGWQDLLDSVEVVQNYLTPDVVKAIGDRHQSAGPPALAAAAPQSDDGIS